MTNRFNIGTALAIGYTSIWSIASVFGQAADSLVFDSSVLDSTVSISLVSDSTVSGNSIRFRPLLWPSNSAIDELGWMNGTFSHSFGTSGWPAGIAPLGRDPNSVSVDIGSLSMNDLITGRPRFDLLPLAWLSELRPGPHLGFVATFDSLSTALPSTLIRYESSGNGSQAVRALHVQNRTWNTASGCRSLQTAFGYSGEGATGEYDGARLRRAHEVTARIRVATAGWQLELFEMAQRRSIGAHTGVIPFNGASYNSIYQRLGASVGDESARRRTLRNDLQIRGSTNRFGMSAAISGNWTVQTLDFEGESATEKMVASKKGLQIDLSRPWGNTKASLKLKTSLLSYVRGTLLESSPDSRTKSSILGSVSGRFRSIVYWATSGPETADGRVWAMFNGTASMNTGPFQIDIALSHSGRELQWHEQIGFGTTLAPTSEQTEPTEQLVSAALSWHSNLFSVAWTGSMDFNHDMLVIQHGNEATNASVTPLYGSSVSTVSSLVLGFRDRTKQGIWAQFNPVFRSTKTDENSIIAKAWRRSMPDMWASATIGWKTTLFQGDLNLNTYVRARYWAEMGGLRLHTPTGLLVLPSDVTETLESNWLMDFVAEAGIRGATLFLSYENAFSGTTALFGNLIVPDYPLPQQRTRFGVFWPISN